MDHVSEVGPVGRSENPGVGGSITPRRLTCLRSPRSCGAADEIGRGLDLPANLLCGDGCHPILIVGSGQPVHLVPAVPQDRGDFTLDLDKREARREDDVIALTPTEYRLLEYFVRNQGRAISEDELSQQVWGDYYQGERSAVRRYVWLLRQKFEDNPSSPRWICTVRGFGYRLGTGNIKTST